MHDALLRDLAAGLNRLLTVSQELERMRQRVRDVEERWETDVAALRGELETLRRENAHLRHGAGFDAASIETLKRHRDELREELDALRQALREIRALA
ncbi:MAG: hypothetical protein L0191_15310, partial [Acidobacteria bacterium]|nr:hypothetical protein [Acidobacteriota bacterium]